MLGQPRKVIESFAYGGGRLHGTAEVYWELLLDTQGRKGRCPLVRFERSHVPRRKQAAVCGGRHRRSDAQIISDAHHEEPLAKLRYAVPGGVQDRVPDTITAIHEIARRNIRNADPVHLEHPLDVLHDNGTGAESLRGIQETEIEVIPWIRVETTGSESVELGTAYSRESLAGGTSDQNIGRIAGEVLEVGTLQIATDASPGQREGSAAGSLRSSCGRSRRRQRRCRRPAQPGTPRRRTPG